MTTPAGLPRVVGDVKTDMIALVVLIRQERVREKAMEM